MLLLTGAGGQLDWSYLDAESFSEVGWTAVENLGSTVTMLADGRLVRHVDLQDAVALEVLTPDGEIDARVDLPSEWTHVTLGSQPTPSSIVIGVREDTSWRWIPEPNPSYSVDLETGEIQSIADGVVPLAWMHGRLEMVHPLPAGCELSKTFLGRSENDEPQQLLLWHPGVDELERVVPAGK